MMRNITQDINQHNCCTIYVINICLAHNKIANDSTALHAHTNIQLAIRPREPLENGQSSLGNDSVAGEGASGLAACAVDVVGD